MTSTGRREGAGVVGAAAGVDHDAVPRLAPTDAAVYRGAQDPGRHLAGRAGEVRPGARSKTAADGVYRKGKSISRNDKRQQ